MCIVSPTIINKKDRATVTNLKSLIVKFHIIPITIEQINPAQSLERLRNKCKKRTGFKGGSSYFAKRQTFAMNHAWKDQEHVLGK